MIKIIDYRTIALPDGFQVQTDPNVILEIKSLRDENKRLQGAVEFAHSEGFEWPADPIPLLSEKVTTGKDNG